MLFFSHPFGSSRVNGWIKASVDGGASWQLWRQVDPGAFGYSTLTVVESNETHVSLGLVYEGTHLAGSPRVYTGGLRWTVITDLLPRVA